MPGSFGAIHSSAGGSPIVRQYSAASNATFDLGNVLILSSNLLAEAGTNPAAGTILGVSMSKAGDVPGRNLANDSTIVARTWADFSYNISLAKGNTFVGKMTNNSATIIPAVLADVGTQIGITAYSAGTWYLDKSKTAGNARVTVIDFDPDSGDALFEFIESFCVNT